MGLIDRIFRGRPRIERAEKALAGGSFAEALLLAQEIDPEEVEACRLEAVLDAAADGLARLNFEEGERLVSAGERGRGAEHLQLALDQVRSVALRQDIEQFLSALAKEVAPPETAVVQRAVSGCSSCGGAQPDAADQGPAVMAADIESQFELLLVAYPAELRERYRESSVDFRRALLLISGGEEAQALELLQHVPESERDALYLFELGSLYGRLGELPRGIELLQQSLAREPRNLLTIDALVEMLLAAQQSDQAQELLERQLAQGIAQGYCHARLCELSHGRQDAEAALAAARKALAAGYAEPGFLVLAAQLLEASGAHELAESLLAGLPGGGCGGGVNLYLAEFWLRQKRDLGKVLDAFNGACRQEPDNPRWQLRVAQTYLARNWQKQGMELLRKVVGDPRLDAGLRMEAEDLLAGRVENRA